MDHERAQDLFTDYVEGTLGADDVKQLEAHLGQCDGCSRELDVFKKTLNSLSGLTADDPAVELVGKVEERINRRSRGRFFGSDRLPVKLPFEWISFVIILLLLALYLMEASHKPKVEAPRPAKNAVPTARDAPASTARDAPASTARDAPASTAPDAPASTAPDAPASTAPDAPDAPPPRR